MCGFEGVVDLLWMFGLFDVEEVVVCFDFDLIDGVMVVVLFD